MAPISGITLEAFAEADTKLFAPTAQAAAVAASIGVQANELAAARSGWLARVADEVQGPPIARTLASVRAATTATAIGQAECSLQEYICLTALATLRGIGAMLAEYKIELHVYFAIAVTWNQRLLDDPESARLVPARIFEEVRRLDLGGEPSGVQVRFVAAPAPAPVSVAPPSPTMAAPPPASVKPSAPHSGVPVTASPQGEVVSKPMAGTMAMPMSALPSSMAIALGASGAGQAGAMSSDSLAQTGVAPPVASSSGTPREAAALPNAAHGIPAHLGVPQFVPQQPQQPVLQQHVYGAGSSPINPVGQMQAGMPPNPSAPGAYAMPHAQPAQGQGQAYSAQQFEQHTNQAAAAVAGAAVAGWNALGAGLNYVASAVMSVGARVLVTWSDGNRYPGTIVALGQGQHLVAMSDGQQHWIGTNYITAT
jgi:hypothetical protein